MKELNKITQDLKRQIETLNQAQRDTTLEMEIPGKRSGVTDASITNRIQETEERISGVEGGMENIEATVKENAKSS